MIFGAIRNYIGEFRAYNRERAQVVRSGKTQKKNRLAGRIIRYVHSIEKGLCIESPRSGYGYDKIQTMYSWIKEYLQMKDIDKTCVYMAADALCAYCSYHDSIGVSSDRIEEVKTIAEELQKIKSEDGVQGIFGGVQVIEKENLSFDTSTIEKLFKTRDSIRQFENTPVSDEKIYKAIELAQSAPSACNRQAVRTYVINPERLKETYIENLQGVGGFVDNCDRIILITGKLSSYEETEYKQFIVSAGIFAGYLTLSLHGLGLGACVVQRSLRPDKSWTSFCKKNDIPDDEQIVCMIVVGNMKERTVVPISNRFETKNISRWL